MPQHERSTRRRVLQAASGLIVMGVAGCVGTPASAGSGSTDTSAGTGHHEESDDHHEGDESEHHDEDTAHHEETEHHETEDAHEHSPTEHESGHEHAHDDPVSPASDAATVDMTSSSAGEHFEPHVTRVHAGGQVTWVNASGTHSATAYHPENDEPLLMPKDAEPFDSGVLTEADAEFSHTFETEGVYHFYCAPHESLGMLGSVIVGEPDPHDQPALGEVPSSLPDRAQQKLEHLNEKCNEALGHQH